MYDVAKNNYLMAAIDNLNRLICFKKWRKHQTCHVAACFNYLIELKQKMLILLEFVATNVVFFFDNKTKFLTADPFKLDVILNTETILSGVSCCILF
jgi:hypothetical protein